MESIDSVEPKGRKWALLAAYDKKPELVEFAKWLFQMGYDLVASAGTAKYLTDAGVLVQDVAQWTGKPPILGHRVVTLSHQIAAGILARRDNTEDMAEVEKEGIKPIDLLFIDLYPFKEAIKNPESTKESMVEMIDIGGPTLICEGTKAGIPTLDYDTIGWFIKDGCKSFYDSDEAIREKTRSKMRGYCAIKVSRYYAEVAKYFDDDYFTFFGEKVDVNIAYGENPLQSPAFYYKNMDLEDDDPLAIHKFKLLNPEKPGGVVNILDVDSALTTITHMDQNFADWCGARAKAVAVKHGNPCGASVGNSDHVTIKNVIHGDPMSIFGGVVMTNFVVDDEMAKTLLYNQTKAKRILAGIVAPGFTKEAIAILDKEGGKKCKLWVNEGLDNNRELSLDKTLRIRHVRGGIIVQPNYLYVPTLYVDAKQYGPLADIIGVDGHALVLAHAVGSTSTSNTITIVKDKKVLANAVGQQDRVGAAQLAVDIAKRSGHDLNGAYAYSDSFFPFPDGLEVLAKAGIKVILASSGSVKDKEVIKRAEELGVSLVLIPDKICRGFCKH